VELSALLHFVRPYNWLIGGAVVAAAIPADVTEYTQLLSVQAMARTYSAAATPSTCSC
jgi:hypothetical protein